MNHLSRISFQRKQLKLGSDDPVFPPFVVRPPLLCISKFFAPYLSCNVSLAAFRRSTLKSYLQTGADVVPTKIGDVNKATFDENSSTTWLENMCAGRRGISARQNSLAIYGDVVARDTESRGRCRWRGVISVASNSRPEDSVFARARKVLSSLPSSGFFRRSFDRIRVKGSTQIFRYFPFSFFPFSTVRVRSYVAA